MVHHVAWPVPHLDVRDELAIRVCTARYSLSHSKASEYERRGSSSQRSFSSVSLHFSRDTFIHVPAAFFARGSSSFGFPSGTPGYRNHDTTEMCTRPTQNAGLQKGCFSSSDDADRTDDRREGMSCFLYHVDSIGFVLCMLRDHRNRFAM